MIGADFEAAAGEQSLSGAVAFRVADLLDATGAPVECRIAAALGP